MRKYNHEVGTFISDINDLEGLVHDSVYYDFKEVIDHKQKELEEWNESLKQECDYYERVADERLQQLISGTNLVDHIMYYMDNTQRINRSKLFAMLEELKNQLNNWYETHLGSLFPCLYEYFQIRTLSVAYYLTMFIHDIIYL